MSIPDGITNRILRSLPPAVLESLSPHFKITELHQGHVMCRPDEPVQESHFINRGVVSLIKRMKDGTAVEIGARGTEGLTAPETLLGLDTPLYEAIVQAPGTAFVIRKSVLQRQFNENHPLRRLVTGYVHAAANQIAQTAACNRLHFLEQRCCRWLLFAHDNAGSDNFHLTQEFLALMLGVHRPGISVALQKFQDAGMVKYVRGQVTITDRRGLEDSSCECYRAVADEYERLFTAVTADRG